MFVRKNRFVHYKRTKNPLFYGVFAVRIVEVKIVAAKIVVILKITVRR